jgi:hypothetical protein
MIADKPFQTGAPIMDVHVFDGARGLKTSMK